MNGHFRNVGTGTIFSKIVYFTNQQKINYPNSFHIDSDGGNIEKFHHLGGDEIKLWCWDIISTTNILLFFFDIKTRTGIKQEI